MTEVQTTDNRDWVSSKVKSLLIWGLPIAAIVVSGFVDVSQILRTIIWTVSLLIMGAGCIMNARQCSRTHCYFTGPFFLILALVTAVHGFGIFSFGPSGWSWIGYILLGGGIGLTCVPELIKGRYLR